MFKPLSFALCKFPYNLFSPIRFFGADDIMILFLKKRERYDKFGATFDLTFLGQFMINYAIVLPNSGSPLTFHKPVTEKNFCIFHSGETIM